MPELAPPFDICEEAGAVGTWSIVFLLVAISAALLDLTTLTDATFDVAKILALIFGVLAIVALLAANRARPRE